MASIPSNFNDLKDIESIFNLAAIGIARVDLDGSWLSVNQQICDILGYNEEALYQQKFQSITHPEDLDLELQLINEVIEGKRNTYSMAKRYICKMDKLIWTNLTASLVKDESGKPSYFIWIVENITWEKTVQAELRRDKNFFDRAINSSLAVTTHPL